VTVTLSSSLGLLVEPSNYLSFLNLLVFSQRLCVTLRVSVRSVVGKNGELLYAGPENEEEKKVGVLFFSWAFVLLILDRFLQSLSLSLSLSLSAHVDPTLRTNELRALGFSMCVYLCLCVSVGPMWLCMYDVFLP
jgi:hypothetical protein